MNNESDSFTIESTSSQSANVSDVTLSQKQTTRRIARATIVKNPNDQQKSVKVAIVHQRKGRKDSWEDEPHKSLNLLRAGESSKLDLDTTETEALFKHISNLYNVFSTEGVPYGVSKVFVVPYDEDTEIVLASRDRGQVFRKLLESGYSSEFWNELVTTKPNLATKLSYARLHQERKEALEWFEDEIDANDDESSWQKYFESNTWIFGYGLDYRFLRRVQGQPHVGGKSVTGRGEQKGDFLLSTEGVTRFSVIVEIKTPGAKLLGREYRNRAFPASPELSGSVAQVQANCRKWETEGSKSEANENLRSQERIFTYQPKGIVVIGNTNQLGGNDEKASFELFRRNIVNPEIITFDELLERAKFIIETISNEESERKEQ